jgi:ketosteroid isomerase-like protein
VARHTLTGAVHDEHAERTTARPIPGDKPELHLLRGDTLIFEDILALFRALTGREPIEQEIAEARKVWDEVAEDQQTREVD